jgi:hypothetical protein
MTSEKPRSGAAPEAIIGSGKVVGEGRIGSQMAEHKGESKQGILEKGGKSPANVPPAKPAASNEIPKPPQGSGDKGKK